MSEPFTYDPLALQKRLELERKMQARLMLLNPSPGIVEPTRDEMIGLYLLERDDELKRKK